MANVEMVFQHFTTVIQCSAPTVQTVGLVGYFILSAITSYTDVRYYCYI